MELNQTSIPQIEQKDSKPVVDVSYNEPALAGPTPNYNAEQVFGQFNMVTAIPTYTPKSFRDGIAFDTSSSAMYYYDFTNNVWKTVGSSVIAGNGTMSGGMLDVTHPGITSTSRCVATRSGVADSGSFPQIATGYLSGTTMRIFEGSTSKTWSIDYIIYL